MMIIDICGTCMDANGMLENHSTMVRIYPSKTHAMVIIGKLKIDETSETIIMTKPTSMVNGTTHSTRILASGETSDISPVIHTSIGSTIFVFPTMPRQAL